LIADFLERFRRTVLRNAGNGSKGKDQSLRTSSPTGVDWLTFVLLACIFKFWRLLAWLEQRAFMPEERKYFLPRLPREYYQGDAVVHWEMSVVDRKRGWLDDRFQSAFRELMLHVSAREGLFCPVYCLMPDHIHLVWMGLRRDTDQLNGIAFLRCWLEPQLKDAVFQPQAYDSVLREEDRKRNAFAKLCGYILENPLKKELVKHPKDWTFSGCVVPGYPGLSPFDERYWELFWKLYRQQKNPEAGHRVLPFRNGRTVTEGM
jgi:putative transposase